MEANNQGQTPQQQQELDPNIRAIFEDVETKLNQVNLLLVLQFGNNLTMNCLSQLPGITQDSMLLIANPIIAAINSAIAQSDRFKKAQAGQGQPQMAPPGMMQGPSSPMPNGAGGPPEIVNPDGTVVKRFQ
jgi:DNA-binding protein YbaB